MSRFSASLTARLFVQPPRGSLLSSPARRVTFLAIAVLLLVTSCNVHPDFGDISAEGSLDERSPFTLLTVDFDPQPEDGPFPDDAAVFSDGVELTASEADAEIRYTLDGSEPDEGADSIASGETTAALNHDDGRTEIRAFADVAGEETGEEISGSYISEFTVTYDPGDGDGDPVDEPVAFDSEVSLASPDDLEFDKDGHVFAGWNTEEDGTGNAYTETESFEVPKGDTTFFAQWDSGDGEITVYPWQRVGIDIELTGFPEGSVEPEEEGSERVGADVSAVDEEQDYDVIEWAWFVDDLNDNGELEPEESGTDDGIADLEIPTDEIGTYLVVLEVTIDVDGGQKPYTKARELEVLPEAE